MRSVALRDTRPTAMRSQGSQVIGLQPFLVPQSFVSIDNANQSPKEIWEKSQRYPYLISSRASQATRTADILYPRELAPPDDKINDATQPLVSSTNKARDDLLASLRDLKKHYAKATTDIKCVPKSEAIDDAITVVQHWWDELPEAILDFDDEGQIVLCILDEDGFARAGIDFLGRDNIAVFSIIEGTRIIFSGQLNTALTKEIIQLFSKLMSELA